MSGAFLAALAAAAIAAAPADGKGERITVVLVGDTGLNASGAPVAPQGGFKYDQLVTFADATALAAPLLKGDVVFANLETAVIDRNDIPPREKMFVFRTHPNAARDFVRLGINVFSLANNHVLDFGPIGAGETLRHVAALAGDGLKAWPGLARTREEALAPHLFEATTARVAVSAIGIGGGWLPAPEGEAGMLIEPDDYPDVVAALRAAGADLNILSIHYGRELYPLTDETDIERFRREAAGAKATIIVGHHAHVPKGMEVSGNHLVLYGLGNFLHPGMANMAKRDICRDFGVLARAGLARGADGALAIETVEVQPLTAMHIRTEPMAGEESRLRLDVLNYLGARLDNEAEGARGLRFAMQADGSGLWCAKGASDPRCAGWTEPPLASGERAQRIAAACTSDVRRKLVAELEPELGPELGADESAGWPPMGPAPAEYANASMKVDAAAIDQWARATSVRYTLAGEYFGRTEISAGARGDVSDRVLVSFDWDPNAQKITGEPSIRNAASKIANISAAPSACPPAAAAYENFTLTAARASKDGATLVLAGESAAPGDACSAATHTSARGFDMPVPSPMLFGMPDSVLAAEGFERSADRSSLIRRDGAWTWTFTPVAVTP